MSGAAGIRAGGAYVEVFARDGQFNQAMTRVQAKMRAVAATMQRMGTGMTLAGLGLGMPLVQAARQAATFEDALLAMSAAAGLTKQQVAMMAEEAKRLSREMGAAPTDIATAFMELAKAGMTVEEVLGGAGKAAVEFSRVSGVDAERSAVFMKTAMNVFGVSAQEAVDTLSAAADSSETSIANMVESFSQVGSAGQAFNQSLFGISQAMAVLAKSNIVGEEAGTAIKTMLTKLVAPTDDAKEALGRLGLSVADFRDEMGRLLPMAQIAGVFEQALGKMGGSAEELMMAQQALVDVFEQRGIKVITAFTNAGAKGFAEAAKQMQGSNSVAEKFKEVMSGITGQFQRLKSGADLVAIAFGNAIGPALKQTTDVLLQLMGALERFIQAYPTVAVGAAAIAAGLFALGTAAIIASIGLNGLAIILTPGGVIAGAIAVLGIALAKQNGWLEDIEDTGMRLQAVWRKVGIYIAAAFDSQVRSNLESLLKEVDADLAKWQQKHKAEKDRRKMDNAVKPDVPRTPLGGDAVGADGGSGRKYSTAGTFGSTRQLGIGPDLADPMKSVAANTKRTADAVEKIVDHFKQNPREPQGRVIDTTRGGVNDVPPMAKNLGDLPWWAPADEARRLGAFQGNETAADAGRRINESMMARIGEWKRVGEEVDAATSPSRASFLNNPKLFAGRAASVANAASAVSMPQREVSSGFESVVDACETTTASVKESNRMLERMVNKLDGMRTAYQ